MLAFAIRPELMKQYTTSSKFAGVQRHNMMLVAQTEPPSLADRRSLSVGKTADILQCIGATTGCVVAAKQATGAIIHILCGPDEKSHSVST